MTEIILKLSRNDYGDLMLYLGYAAGAMNERKDPQERNVILLAQRIEASCEKLRTS